MPWLRSLLALRAQLSPEHDLEAIEAGVSELLRCGTVAVGEVTNSLSALDALRSAPVLGWVFHEVYGMTAEAGQQALSQARAQRAAQRDWPSHLGYARVPHTLHTLGPELAKELLAESRAAQQRSTIHLAEHAAERAFLGGAGGPFAEFLAERPGLGPDWPPPGLDPIRYAQSLDLLGSDLLVVHLADARPQELAVLAEAQTPVVLCPRSNLFIEVRLPPLPALLEAGLRPALGTDSLASSPSLDVLAEARALHQRFPSVSARALLAMATTYGAAALGLADRLGRLAPGLTPGVLCFELDGVIPADPEQAMLGPGLGVPRVLSRPPLAPPDPH